MSAIGAAGLRRFIPSSERTLWRAAACAAVLYLAYVAATVLDVAGNLTSLVFAVVVIPIPLAAWLTYVKAPPDLRRLWLLLALAATLWFAGSLVWYAFFLAAGAEVPDPPGPWDAVFAAARLTAIVGIVVAMRSIVSFRLAALDASVVTAAGIALGAAFVTHGLEGGVDSGSVILLYSPLLGTLMLMLIVSAALASPVGLPLSTALIGLGQASLTIGSLIYSYQVVQDSYVDVRWADLAYTAGALVSYFAGAVILLRIDRPVRPFRLSIPGHPAGSRGALLICLVAIAITLAVTAYGLFLGNQGLAVIGLAATVPVGVAMALRARDSIRTVEDAYGRLDQTLVETERARDELSAANVQIRATQIAFADLLNLADERTDGRMRELIEETGDDLAEILEDQLKTERQQSE